MAGGKTKIESSNNLNNENDDDKGAEFSFADARINSESTNPNFNTRNVGEKFRFQRIDQQQLKNQ